MAPGVPDTPVGPPFPHARPSAELQPGRRKESGASSPGGAFPSEPLWAESLPVCPRPRAPAEAGFQENSTSFFVQVCPTKLIQNSHSTGCPRFSFGLLLALPRHPDPPTSCPHAGGSDAQGLSPGAARPLQHSNMALVPTTGLHAGARESRLDHAQCPPEQHSRLPQGTAPPRAPPVQIKGDLVERPLPRPTFCTPKPHQLPRARGRLRGREALRPGTAGLPQHRTSRSPSSRAANAPTWPVPAQTPRAHPLCPGPPGPGLTRTGSQPPQHCR